MIAARRDRNETTSGRAEMRAPSGTISSLDERGTEEWIAGLDSKSGTEELHTLLLRVAHAEANRRGPRAGIVGAELDDLAMQAADDATIAVLAKLATFRGESRFTTWAFKFVILEVATKVTRHAWRRTSTPLDEHAWEMLPDRLGYGPEAAVAGKELAAGIRSALDELTTHQRDVFTAIVVDHVPLDELVVRLGSNRNAIYKTLFDARRKVRRLLVANGYVDDADVEARHA